MARRAPRISEPVLIVTGAKVKSGKKKREKETRAIQQCVVNRDYGPKVVALRMYKSSPVSDQQPRDSIRETGSRIYTP